MRACCGLGFQRCITQPLFVPSPPPPHLRDKREDFYPERVGNRSSDYWSEVDETNISYSKWCIYTETFSDRKHIWYSGHFQGDWLRHSNSQVRVPRSLRAPVTIPTASRSVPQTPVGANCAAYFVHWPQKKKESQQFVKCHSLCVCSSAGQLSS